MFLNNLFIRFIIRCYYDRSLLLDYVDLKKKKY